MSLFCCSVANMELFQANIAPVSELSSKVHKLIDNSMLVYIRFKKNKSIPWRQQLTQVCLYKPSKSIPGSRFVVVLTY